MTRYFEINHVQGSPEWIKWRKEGIGASDVAAILGVSPYITAYKLYKIKKNLCPDYEISEFAKIAGATAEDDSRQAYNEISGKVFMPKCFEFVGEPRFKCSLDGWDNGEILEAKFVGSEYLKEILDGKPVRQDHYAQLQWQMFITGSPHVNYFIIDKQNNKVYTKVLKDDSYIEVIVQKVKDFLTRMDTNCPPDVSEDDYLEAPELIAIRLTTLARLKEELDRTQKLFDSLKYSLLPDLTHNKYEVSQEGIKFYKNGKNWTLKVKSKEESC